MLPIVEERLVLSNIVVISVIVPALVIYGMKYGIGFVIHRVTSMSKSETLLYDDDGTLVMALMIIGYVLYSIIGGVRNVVLRIVSALRTNSISSRISSINKEFHANNNVHIHKVTAEDSISNRRSNKGNNKRYPPRPSRRVSWGEISFADSDISSVISISDRSICRNDDDNKDDDDDGSLSLEDIMEDK